MVETPEAYVPERGDAIWINLQPQAGHEQAGRRPAVVLSPSVYNGRVGLALLCPITNQRKGYPFEVRIPPQLRVTSNDSGGGAGETCNPVVRPRPTMACRRRPTA